MPQIPSFAQLRAQKKAAEPVVEEEDEPPPPPPSEDGVLGACRDDDREAEARGRRRWTLLLQIIWRRPSARDYEGPPTRRRRVPGRRRDRVELRRQLEVEKEVAEEVEGERTKIESAAEARRRGYAARPRPVNGPRPTLRRWIH